MFSKTFLLAVLFCAVVYANAAPEPHYSLRLKREAGDKVKAFIAEQKQKIKDFGNKVKNAVVSFWNRITGKESAEKQREINELQGQLQQLQRESVETLRRTQERYNALLQEQQEKLVNLNGRNRELIERQNKILNELQAQADEELNAQINDYDRQINELGKRIQRVLDE